jgi:ppGpp synthetase/RelA/SpoT-type nucleotidyltranferase
VARPEGISKSQMQRLGKRIAPEGTVAPADLALLRIVFDHYQSAMQEMHGKVEPVVDQFGRSQNLNLVVTSRLKNTETIREKIRRMSTNFARMEDVAGLRIVGTDGLMTLYDQDELCQRIVRAVGQDALINYVDRRTDPRAGYRAVHLIVECADVPVEIQVRTALQDAWAQLYEKCGDSWGREIRYGEALRHADEPAGVMPGTRQQAVDFMLRLSKQTEQLELIACRLQDLELHFSNATDQPLSDNDILDRDEERRQSVAEAKSMYRELHDQMMQDLLSRLGSFDEEGA